MNNVRRMRLAKVQQQIAELRDELMLIVEEEAEVIDNLPDSLRESERWQEAESNLEDLSDAVDTLDDVCETLSTIVEG